MSNEVITKITQLIKESDCILIGAGAGLSAAAGMNYGDPVYFQKKFPLYAATGLKTIGDCFGLFWDQTDENRLKYWCYWSNHLKANCLDNEAFQVYKDLYDIVKDRDYFVLTTNVDEQFKKAGFNHKRYHATQGSYEYFQCSKRCTEDVYNNREYVEKMWKNKNEKTLEVRECDIPHCPKCGAYMENNLRKDDLFAEYLNLSTADQYHKWLENHINKKILYLEIGVGFNTPSIIKYPFMKMTYSNENAKLVRINLEGDSVPPEIKDRSLVVKGDVAKVLTEIKKIL